MRVKSFWQVILMTIFVAVVSIDSAWALDTDEAVLFERIQLHQQGFESWQWLSSDCDRCELVILPLNAHVRSEKVRLFIEALADYKFELQNLYGIHGAEYNLLAHMAVGILGCESSFFRGIRYSLKEISPEGVHTLKVIRAFLEDSNRKPTPNSRGPTQIKYIPEKVAKKYGLVPDNLYVPENAAIATMGYLIEALSQLKNRIANNKISYITKENYADYLPYIYFGRTAALLDGTATPQKNRYVLAMKRFMSWVHIYERKSISRNRP